MNSDAAASAFREFVNVIKALRAPGTGCPWDLEQTHQTLRPYLLEETYEVLEAIDRADDPHLKEELGDLLLQIVLHAQLAADRAAFSIVEIIQAITDKMVRRHPHVFGDIQVENAAEVSRNWDQIKAAEKQTRGDDPFAGIPAALPALLRAQQVAGKAERLGGDKPTREELLAALHRRLDELQDSPAEERLGDFLFDVCRLARRLDLSAEDTLRESVARFVERFKQDQRAGESIG